jgi:hypothetical protein
MGDVGIEPITVHHTIKGSWVTASRVDHHPCLNRASCFTLSPALSGGYRAS